MRHVNPRNACQCGSGKKYRDCCMKKRPREIGIAFRVPEDTKADAFLVGLDGTLRLGLRGHPITMVDTAVELSYSRPKGRKVLVRAPVDPAQPMVNPNSAVLRYNTVFAVDTNTKQLQSERLSVACIVQLIRDEKDGRIQLRQLPSAAIELRNPQGDPERIAWRLVCELIMADPSFTPNLRVAIVVDSSLSELRAINKHETPVRDEWFLPEGFELIYASADSVTDTIWSRLISTCDKEGAMLLSRIENNLAMGEWAEGRAGEPWSHIRYRTWNSDSSR